MSADEHPGPGVPTSGQGAEVDEPAPQFFPIDPITERLPGRTKDRVALALGPGRDPSTPAPWRTPEPGTPTHIQRSPTASLVAFIRPNGAVILLGAVFLLALIEIIAAYLAYREQVTVEDWVEVAEILDSREAVPLLIAHDWLAPRARMELAEAREWNSVAPPDLRGVNHFWVLGFGRDVWTPAIAADLEGLPMPKLVGIHTIGELILHEYEQADAGVGLWSLLDLELGIASDTGRCPGKSNNWSCKDGRVSTRVVEVDYRPRRCLALGFEDGVTARVDLGTVELGNRLRGHIGFGDFNSRLRADPTVMLSATIDEIPVARWLFTDDQGWAAFALATEPGPHRVEFAISSSVGGTWQREGHRPLPTDLVCFEARAFEESELTTASSATEVER